MIRKIKGFFFTIYQEIRKITSGYIFGVMIIGVTLILMSGTVLLMPETSSSYSVFQIIPMKAADRREVLLLYEITFERIFMWGTDGYLWMFAPVLVSAPFVMPMCVAKKNNNIRFEIFRSGKWEYVLAKGISAVLCGGVIMCLGYALFTGVIWILLPRISTGGADMEYFIVSDMPLVLGDYGKRFLEMFFYGMSSTILTYTLSGFVRNKYLVLCIPFMINYFLKTELSQIKFAENKLAHMINPSTPSYVFTRYGAGEWKVVLFWCGLAVFGMVLYRIALGRRCDCGE